MIVLRVFKNKDGRLHYATHFMTIEGYSRWAKTNKFYNLICLLPVGTLTLTALKNGYFSDFDLQNISRTPSQIHYPPYTLRNKPITQPELFFLSHKTDPIPTFNSQQIGDIFKAIVNTRAYLDTYVLGKMHPYTTTMLDLNYNESYTGLENGFEFPDFQGSTVAI